MDSSPGSGVIFFSPKIGSLGREVSSSQKIEKASEKKVVNLYRNTRPKYVFRRRRTESLVRVAGTRWREKKRRTPPPLPLTVRDGRDGLTLDVLGG